METKRLQPALHTYRYLFLSFCIFAVFIMVGFSLLSVLRPAHTGAAGTHYYVDATGGSDSNSGMDTSHPWKTIAKVNSSSFMAGDFILFKRGEIWRNEQITNTASVTYGAYGTGNAPSIRGSVTYNDTSNWTQDTTDVTVSGLKPGTGSDDGYWEVGGGAGPYNNTFSQFKVGTWFNGFDDINGFVRFPGVTVPQGATITAASVTLNADQSKEAGTIRMSIKAIAADSATAPTSAADGDSRTLTTASTSWNISSWTAGNDITSPSLTGIAQEIVNRGGWSSGNALVLYFLNNSSDNGAVGYPIAREGSATLDARLSITYSQATSNIWYIPSVAHDPGVFVHDGVLGTRKTSKGALTAPWDYYWYSGTNKLFVYSTSNPANNASLLEVAMLDKAFDYIHWNNVTVDSLDFRHFRGLVAVNFFGGSTGWSFTNDTFAQLAGYGIQFHGHTGNLTASVDHCSFIDWGVVDGQQYAIQTIADSGIGNSARAEVTNNNFTINHSSNDTEITAVMSDTGGWVRTFTGNTLTNNGNWPGPGMMIWRPSANTTAITIAGNSLYRMGSIGLGVQELEYHGAAPTVVIKNNYIEASDQNDILDTEGLRLRDFTATSNVTASYNVINGTKAGSHAHPGIYISNALSARIYNNTIYGADQGILAKQASTDTDIRNNIVSSNRTYGIRLEDTSTATNFNHNLFHGNVTANYSGIAAGSGDVTANPLFAAAGSDFALQRDSPAINAGAVLGLSSDIAGTIVPLGHAPDIGAYEFLIASSGSTNVGSESSGDMAASSSPSTSKTSKTSKTNTTVPPSQVPAGNDANERPSAVAQTTVKTANELSHTPSSRRWLAPGLGIAVALIAVAKIAAMAFTKAASKE